MPSRSVSATTARTLWRGVQSRGPQQWGGRIARYGVLVMLIALAASAGAARQAAAAPDLTGVWTLVSYTRDGRLVPMVARLVITPKHFTRVLMEKERPSFEGFDFRKVDALTPAQLKIIAEAYPRFNASAGTWRVAGNRFYFTSDVHHNPGAVGNEADRTFELTGDRLRMYAQAGSGQVDELWQRVERF